MRAVAERAGRPVPADLGVAADRRVARCADRGQPRPELRRVPEARRGLAVAADVPGRPRGRVVDAAVRERPHALDARRLVLARVRRAHRVGPVVPGRPRDQADHLGSRLLGPHGLARQFDTSSGMSEPLSSATLAGRFALALRGMRGSILRARRPLRHAHALVSDCLVVRCLLAVGVRTRDRPWMRASAPSARRGTCNRAKRASATPAQKDTEGVGPCVGGMQTCTAAGQWGNCDGQVIPVGETCGDGVDNNCNGAVDENDDRDGDGFTTCGGDCCDSTECCDAGARRTRARSMRRATTSTTTATAWSTTRRCSATRASTSNSTNAKDFAKAIDICQTATMTDKKWGVISATLTLPDGTGAPDASLALDPPALRHEGRCRAAASTWRCSRRGIAAAQGRHEPGVPRLRRRYAGHARRPRSRRTSSRRTAASCRTRRAAPIRAARPANDPVMLTLDGPRADERAQSFSLKTNFYSAEYPEWTCSRVQRLLRRAARLDVHRHAREPDRQEPRVLHAAGHDEQLPGRREPRATATPACSRSA